jgi:pyruvate,orthophosphate dikinase
LQTRSAKRSASAAIRAAVEMSEEGLLSRSEAILRVPPSSIHEMLSPQLDLAALASQPIARGLAASPDSAVGQLVFTADRAVALAGKRKESRVILVREETSAEDIHGMDAAVGFVTAHGGATSHAAVVARGMGKCCITGANGLKIDEARGVLRAGGFELKEGDWLSIDGATGRIFAGQLPLKTVQSDNPWLKQLLAWSRKEIGSSVRANADTPDDAERAREFNASGIGLCRTEHMFFASDRLPHVRAMILAQNAPARQAALDLLLPMQQEDFEGLFHVMAGFPVTIRLIDPPLHEFLPSLDEARTALSEARKQQSAQVPELEHVLARIRQLSETNPMMGHRGCRLGITYPEIIAMQVRAILRTAIIVQAEGVPVEPEIMIPLVSSVEEIRFLRKVIVATAEEVFAEEHETVRYRLGTMIELPRAAMCAGAIAREVDFLSFGTNDLTQMTFGFSRDDASRYLDTYLELGILKEDPFLILDQEGVGQLIRMAVLNARQANPSIKIGVCGEHAGDPRSIEFLHSLGVDYVSASPARIPIAQLALAQAHLKSAPPSEAHSFSSSPLQEESDAVAENINA